MFLGVVPVMLPVGLMALGGTHVAFLTAGIGMSAFLAGSGAYVLLQDHVLGGLLCGHLHFLLHGLVGIGAVLGVQGCTAQEHEA